MPASSNLIADHLISSLYTYCSDGMGYELHHQPHDEMCDFFESVLPPPPAQMQDAEQTYAMFLGPRETLKTSIGAQGLAEYFLVKWKRLYNYDGRVLIVRASFDAAETVTGAIREDLSNGNPTLQRAFGDLSIDAPMWKTHAITLNWRDKIYREPSVDSAGTGMSKTGYHVDLVIIDDIANEKNFESEVEMMKARRYIQAVMPILNNWGSMLVIGTRWGHNDPYAWILEKNATAQAENEELKRQGKPERPLPWKVMIRSVWREEPGHEGEPYYPAWLPPKKILQKQRNMEEKMFTACYLNKVVQESSRVFKPTYLRYFDGIYNPDDEDGGTLEITDGAYKGLTIPVRCTMHCDPASTATSTSNFTAICVVLTDADNNYWIWDSFKYKKVPSENRSFIVAEARHTLPEEFSIDTLGQQVLWVDDIERDFKDAGLKTRVLLHKGKALKDGKITTNIRSKASRIESLEPFFREGRIFLRSGHCGPIVQEYNFYDGPTATNHFDMLDAMAQIPVFCKPPRPRNFKAEELEAKEWEDEFGDDEPVIRKVKGTWAGR